MSQNPTVHVRGRFSIAALLAGCVVAISASTARCADANNEDGIRFFEEKVRPLLSAKCYECHGPEKSESGLRLDSRASILRGGASDTPAAQDGDPEHSLLIESVKHEGDYEMPPDEPLSEAEIDHLHQWIKMGMPWPEEAPVKPTLTVEQRVSVHRSEHWSLQPVKSPTIPESDTTSSVDSPRTKIDRLLEPKLADAGLSFSPVADRRTLIRRATYDLIGLPPTQKQIDAFVNDERPDAWPRLIDQLLDSPHYGERWARHWLDVARYADTRGYSPGGRDKRFPFAYTYRDWVIKAFNRDLPYDDFVRCQLAADMMDSAEPADLAALGFLTVGRQYLNRLDVIDDQVDAVTRGILGLTVSCARCHDHKFDAIPTQDYYSLFSIFENCSSPDELPLIIDEAEKAKFSEFLGKLEAEKQAIEKRLDEIHEQLKTQTQEHPTDYLARVIESSAEREAFLQEQDFISLKPIEVHPRLLNRWKAFVNRKDAARMKVFMPWHELLALGDDGFAESAQRKIEGWNELPAEKLNPLVLDALLQQPLKNKTELARVYGKLIHDQWGARDEENAKSDPSRKALLDLLSLDDSPLVIKREKIREMFDQGQRNDVAKREGKINELNSNAPEGLDRAMIVVDREHPGVTRVMIRGNAGRRGEEAPRRFLKLLSPEDRPVFQNGAGRLELADAIVSKDNPLTARVFVNRVWMHHFNQPLVDTPSDFGIQCPEPVQRDVLDFLAADFMQNGWSVKRLHRQIMLSHAYRQSSVNRDDCLQVDPENRLWWRMNRRRLEFESFRDSLLAVAGNLDAKLFGKSAPITTAPFSHRRTIYGTIDRQDLPNLFRAFDFASPDQSVSKRSRTIVPQQSLFMLNSPFAIEQSQQLVAHVNSESEPTDDQRIAKLYQTIFGRQPTAEELEIGKQFVTVAEPQLSEPESPEAQSSETGKADEAAQSDAASQTPAASLDVWTRYAQMLLMTNEFEFID
ncbi:PSD1 and planctomycete cytochrome C domain-containing protein [Rhodopirellula sp. ICT_H3.1]|uniref:PSD1 and planctomycete cytochrome C domain-containing protein n=1 Tax=Aporhodopirellula aestuarii TaxID=2950107 RepID=A0ABT0UE00_9BACT|nr:PSD1 and planctomycete cytochrome C domain-containing protein [Aporhodopirellula aestuarii]